MSLGQTLSSELGEDSGVASGDGAPGAAADALVAAEDAGLSAAASLERGVAQAQRQASQGRGTHAAGKRRALPPADDTGGASSSLAMEVAVQGRDKSNDTSALAAQLAEARRQGEDAVVALRQQLRLEAERASSRLAAFDLEIGEEARHKPPRPWFP